MPVNNEERTTRYWLLRKVGFSSKDATRYKDLSIDKVGELVRIRKWYNSEERLIFNTYIEMLREILK